MKQYHDAQLLEGFFRSVAAMTSNHAVISDTAVVTAQDLGRELENVDPEWYKIESNGKPTEFLFTPAQREVIAELERRGAWMTASSARQAWKAGEEFCFDPRNNAKRGLMRKVALCNKQAKGEV